jgi:argininosuccinate synthase
MHSSDVLFQNIAGFVYNGFWFSLERETFQALVTETQREVNGLVRLKICKGNFIVAGRKSLNSLYDPKIATKEGRKSTYDQSDATGFIPIGAINCVVNSKWMDRLPPCLTKTVVLSLNIGPTGLRTDA